MRGPSAILSVETSVRGIANAQRGPIEQAIEWFPNLTQQSCAR
jgi:hypothetical protein